MKSKGLLQRLNSSKVWGLFFSQVIPIIVTVFLSGCGSSSDGTNTMEDDVISFEGVWQLYELMEGCGSDIVNRIEITVFQNGNEATFTDGYNDFVCRVEGDELHCSGEIRYDDGYRLSYDWIRFWHDGNGGLRGDAQWTHYDTRNYSCYGTSTFTPRNWNDSQSEFNGQWLMKETLYGYNCTGEIEYSENIYQVDIIETNENSVVLSYNGQPFDCILTGEELQCSGRVQLFNGGQRDYPTYNLRFTADNLLAGDATWNFTHPDYTGCQSRSLLMADRDNAADNDDRPTGTVSVTNNTQITFKQINIVPCGGDRIDDEDWGPDRMHPTLSLVPTASYKFNSIPEGCYDMRVCPVDENAQDAGCYYFIGSLEVTEGDVEEIELN